MKMNNTTRNRRVGFLGVAVVTLLSPAGKLISSAVAAGATVALITMSGGPKVVDLGKSPVPKLATSSELIDEYFANELAATSEPSLPEPGAELLATKENSAGLMLASMPSTVVPASNTANGPSGGGLFDLPALGPGFGPPPVVIRDPEVDCEQVLKKDDTEKTELEKALCDSIITQTEEMKEEIVKLITEVTPETITDGTPAKGDPNPGVQPLAFDDSPQIPGKGLNPPADPGTPENNPDDSPIIQASGPMYSDLPVAITAIPEPSTIGLLLLGLFSLGWVYRRNTGA